MGPTVEELNKVLEIKSNIKQSIINKGIEITDTTPFADYPSKIDSIEVGGGGDPFYETMWNYITNNGTDYSYLFSYYDGTILDLSNLDTSNVNDTNSMFEYCSSLITLDVSNFDTSNVTNMASMFANCTKLTSVDVSNFDTSKVTTVNQMFTYCKALTSLDCSSWDLSKASVIGTAFNQCPVLVDFIAPKNIGAAMSVANSTVLSHDSLMSIINNLITVTSSKKLTLGSTNLAKLTDEEKAIATNKGWTLA